MPNKLTNNLKQNVVDMAPAQCSMWHLYIVVRGASVKIRKHTRSASMRPAYVLRVEIPVVHLTYALRVSKLPVAHRLVRYG
jgi:hypothetical protein